MVWFTSSVSLLVFCLVSLSFIERRVLLPPPIIVELSVFPLVSVSFCFIYFSAPLLAVYMFIIVVSP